MAKTLCIGGPLDGQLTTETAPQFTSLMFPPAGFTPKDAPVKDEYATPVLYTRRQITGPAEPIIFYTSESVTEHGAIVRVFTAYAKQHASAAAAKR